ncbi:ankyrin [Annulohypoxylon truncatum]|uniref:ankyrin n=1 Tax=Annulohypoxylon truncatum TaxID=327061 RepID=UPI0020079C54|nr:ankyrin [Annulohypoxylon truncatum]KAI1204727.1 ankyrin [Annulohypoxylon truncatum]
MGTRVNARRANGNPDTLNERNPIDGLTPLATATVVGDAEKVKRLLDKGVEADARSRNGETPLLLAAWKTSYNRSRIIQLLLTRTPSSSVDATCDIADNNTPLMFAVTKGDLESIRLLRKAGASIELENDSHQNAEEMARMMGGRVPLALHPETERGALGKLSSLTLSFLLSVVSWVNIHVGGVVRRIFGLNPDPDEDIDKEMDILEEPSGEELVESVERFVDDNPILQRFFKGKEDYIKELTQKAVDLKNDTSTCLGCEELLPKTINVSLHQQVLYCDDSSSMRREGRWESQKCLVERIAKITTRILPEHEGVMLRFINQDMEHSSNLNLEGIGKVFELISWQRENSHTKIGTYLKSKILEPLVYSKLESEDGGLERPLLISVVTDGMPTRESPSEFVEAILECGNRLERAGYPRKSVKFMVGQVGSGRDAARFLDGLRGNAEISEVVYCTTDQLDAKFTEFRENEWDLDRWLIETLFSPIKGPETSETR